MRTLLSASPYSLVARPHLVHNEVTPDCHCCDGLILREIERLHVPQG